MNVHLLDHLAFGINALTEVARTLSAPLELPHMNDIINNNPLSTACLVINERVVYSGRIHTPVEAGTWLAEALEAAATGIPCSWVSKYR